MKAKLLCTIDGTTASVRWTFDISLPPPRIADELVAFCDQVAGLIAQMRLGDKSGAQNPPTRQ